MMRLSNLAQDFEVIGGDARITGISCDSRLVEPGFLFAALPGTQADGRNFIEMALEKGAGAILSTPGLPNLPVPYVAAADPRLAYSRLASRFYPGQPQTLVAMTGTNGKSSTVEFLRQIWAYAGLKAACFGTLGVEYDGGHIPLSHTTPDAVILHQVLSRLAQMGITHVAMEASSHGLMQRRLDSVKITSSGFSNLTQDHFDYHNGMDDYFAAKARLFTELTPPNALVAINVNDAYGQKLAQICFDRGQTIIRTGWTGTDIRIAEVSPRAASQIADLVIEGERRQVEVPLVGEFQLLNAVLALALARITGVDLDLALAALSQLKGVAGRLELAGRTKDGAPVLVDFAHTEDGLDKLLRSVRPHTMGRLLIVFGCGGDRDPDKRAKMGAAAARLADGVIVTDDNPRSEDPAFIRAQVLKGCPGADEIGDRGKAISRGISRLGPQDCLVIAGKGHEQGQIVGDKIIPFSDVDVARRALAEAAYV